jgi:steroid delta-isomerase-like uncharacterized protein
MTTTERAAIVRRYLAEFSAQGGQPVSHDILAPDFALDHAGIAGTINGPAAFRVALETFRAAFPDLHTSVDEVIGEGNAVAVRLRWEGTHAGEFLGIKATGRAFTVTGTAMCHVIDGRITRAWTEINILALLQQIGAFPLPAPTGV